MIFNQFSRTAEAAAALRAWGAMTPEGRAVFHDPHALRLTSRVWRARLKNPTQRKLLMDGLLRWMQPIAHQVLARSHHAEARLQAAKVSQYVIVGAGLDSFHWRRPAWAKKLTVFELDHPATQAMKRARCAARALLGEPQWVACNFERESAADALRRSSFDAAQPAFFAWLGVTHYLKPAATRATLAALAEVAAPGSELVFDYSVPPSQIRLGDWPLAAGLGVLTAVLGEPLVGGIKPGTLAEWAHETGWTVMDDLVGPPAGDLHLPQVTRFAHWRRG
ncbi:MAG: class I SAM-dependent methyltransferase [Stagnimonas sp.]|nr:class I SAM-dependent methyltransferase [Stagnimonas sp.]